MATVAYGLFMLVISLVAIAAGRGYVRTAQRMRGCRSVPGTVTDRGLRSVGTERSSRSGSARQSLAR